ncbi:FxsA family protein, partial [Escherichia coli]|uniref:FxsA family protein n=1 Tax=Escherichia coli TaxID=562 RepID=UPI00136C5532
ALTKAYGTGRLPSGELADAALVLVGGALLMLPGFVTDLFGLLFLLPFTRPLARKAVAFLIARRVASMGFDPGRSRPTVIPGETVEPPTGATDDPRVIRGEVEG